MPLKPEEITIILQIISSLIAIASFSLIINQAFINYNFHNYKTKKLTAERLLYEQFSQEIYDNIQRKPFLRIYKEEDEDNTRPSNGNLNFEIKIDSYFDCQGIKDDELNEKICQDKVITNYTCCRSECCFRSNAENDNIYCNDYSFILYQIPSKNKELIYNDEEKFEDPRIKYCKYFNKYNGETDYYDNNKKLKYEIFEFNYEELMLNKNNNFFIGKSNIDNKIDCGILDTLGNHLYKNNIAGYYCPKTISDPILTTNYENSNNDYSDKSIIIRNILSEIPPYIHEWKNNLISLTNENTKQNSMKESININDFNKIISTDTNYYHQIQTSFTTISNVGIYNIDPKINSNTKLNWYILNYIGFGTSEDLNNFEKIFIKNEPQNNPLYKIGINLYPLSETFIIGFIFIFLFILYIILLSISLYKLKNNTLSNIILLIISFIIKEVLIIFTVVAGWTVYIIKLKEFYHIDIDMDIHYKEILDLYNRRRIQIYFLIGLIFISLIFILEVAYFIYFTIKSIRSSPNQENNINNNNESALQNQIQNDNNNRNNRENERQRSRNGSENQILRSSTREQFIAQNSIIQNHELNINVNNNIYNDNNNVNQVITYQRNN